MQNEMLKVMALCVLTFTIIKDNASQEQDDSIMMAAAQCLVPKSVPTNINGHCINLPASDSMKSSRLMKDALDTIHEKLPDSSNIRRDATQSWSKLGSLRATTAMLSQYFMTNKMDSTS